MQQYLSERTAAVSERTKKAATTAFNYTTSAGDFGRRHYMADTCTPASTTVFKVQKKRKRPEGDLEEREEEKEQRVKSLLNPYC